MGQYYIVIILGENNISKHEFIRGYISPPMDQGSKLMEHSYIQNSFVNSVEFLFTPKGTFYKSRLVWAGDYADPEPELNENLYNLILSDVDKSITLKSTVTSEYRYIINHTKRVYVDKNKHHMIHPLPLLVVEGNGRGGGDYYGTNNNCVGAWARDVISIEIEKPDSYLEYECFFSET
jgi:hypothetical protein